VLKLFRKQWARTASLPSSVPISANGVIYAVGDVHGRHDLLIRLLDRIARNVEADGSAPLIVFLGDYIDRGENAREAVETLIDFSLSANAETVFLRGNHEQMLLDFLNDPASGARWLRYGGLQTLMSYGVGGTGSLRAEAELLRLRDALIEALGPHLGFIERLRESHLAGNLFFAHAGADPVRPTDDQDIETLLWECENFRTTEREDGIWVVHGHFVVEEAAAERGRIAVDTGAYFSGKLTAVRIADGEVSFIQA